jgi:serine/threonine protein kinase
MCVFYLGSVFRAKNRLDNRIYAIKKIVFNENTDRTRRQAKRALREVRVLASLTHPNIVQYHCAWIELVPIEILSPSEIKKSIPKCKQDDSLDELIQFEGQSFKDQIISSPDDDSEVIQIIFIYRLINIEI